MNGKSIVAILIAFVGLVFVMSSCEKIDAGHAGIKVDMYGDDKGVGKVAAVTGRVWFNPINTEIFEVPTYVRNVTWNGKVSERSENNEEFIVMSKEGLRIGMDVSLDYRTEQVNVPRIFEKFRKPPGELENEYIRTQVTKVLKSVTNNYPAEKLYSSITEFEKSITLGVRKVLEPEGFTIELITVPDIRFPESVISNIEAKASVTQEALKEKEKVNKAIYAADKKIETARGTKTADSILAESKYFVTRKGADASNYEIKRKLNLSARMIQEKALDKWDGKLSTYNGSVNWFKGIGKANSNLIVK